MQKFKNLLLRLVIPTITLILVTQLIIMTREITWQAIWSSINDVAWWQAALLILLGLRSECCAAKIEPVSDEYWPHYGRCVACRKWVD